MNVTSTKAEIFAIRCKINYAVYLQDVTYIVIITGAIPAAKWIFNMFIHSYQPHYIAILKDLRFFQIRTPTT